MLDQSTHLDHSLRFFIVATLFIFSIHNTCADTKQQPIFAPTILLNSGHSIPVVGLGTSKAKNDEGENAVKDAIDIGYRHIDTAYVYGNEKEVGRAINKKINDGTVKREDVFVTTKLWSTFHEPEVVPKAFQQSLENLNLTYVDLYLMHTPMAYKYVSKTTNSTPSSIDDTNLFPADANGKTPWLNVDYIDTWKAMEELVTAGKVRTIGVSNFNSEQLKRLNELATIKPAVNQVECHPNLNQRNLIEHAKAINVKVIAYSPLGRPHAVGDKKLALTDPKVLQLAEKYKKTPAQIILRYTHQNGAIVIPKSTNKERLQGNINIFDFSLSEDDMQTLHTINSNTRLLNFDSDVENPNYPFTQKLT